MSYLIDSIVDDVLLPHRSYVRVEQQIQYAHKLPYEQPLSLDVQLRPSPQSVGHTIVQNVVVWCKLYVAPTSHCLVINQTNYASFGSTLDCGMLLQSPDETLHPLLLHEHHHLKPENG